MAKVSEIEYIFDNVQKLNFKVSCPSDPSGYSPVSRRIKGIRISDLIRELQYVIDNNGDGYLTDSDSEYFVCGMAGANVIVEVEDEESTSAYTEETMLYNIIVAQNHNEYAPKGTHSDE